MNIVQTSWKTLHLLAWHEGNLLASRAQFILQGFMSDSIQDALQMAAHVVTVDAGYGVPLSPYSREVFNEICSIAREIDEQTWLTELEWCAQIREENQLAVEAAELQEPKVSEVEYGGQRYLSCSYSGSWTAGLVWEPSIMSESGYYQIRAMQNEHIVATVSELQDARRIALYAASHDGGYGDVCICRCNAMITHEGFEAWFLN